MQFTNTSGVTSQTDTNQHNAGGELHARLRNDEQHTSTPGPAGVEGAGGTGGPDRGAGGRRRSLSTHKRQARPIGGAAGPAGPGRASHRHPDRLEAAARPAGPGRGAGGRRQGLAGLRDRPLRAKLACGDLAGGPPPTGTHSGPAQQNKPRGGRAWPGIEPTRRAPSAAKAQLVWRTPEGPAAVPVGGGRAWPGFEIDHSERRSCVAISRAGRRPPAPTRRHKHSATNT